MKKNINLLLHYLKSMTVILSVLLGGMNSTITPATSASSSSSSSDVLNFSEAQFEQFKKISADPTQSKATAESIGFVIGSTATTAKQLLDLIASMTYQEFRAALAARNDESSPLGRIKAQIQEERKTADERHRERLRLLEEKEENTASPIGLSSYELEHLSGLEI